MDPWRVLDEATASPAAADAAAREALGAFAPGDRRRAAGLTRWLVGRAALDGSTALPTPVLARALRAYGVADPTSGTELAAGEGRVVRRADEDLVALAEVARAEESIARDAARLLTGPAPALRCAVDYGRTAHRMTVAEVAELLRSAPAGRSLVLGGDPDALEPPGPGRPFRDLVASGLVPVDLAMDAPVDSALDQVVAAVRNGRLPAVPPDQREVVVVPCRSAGEAVTRAGQLVTTSIPRAFPGREVLVLAVRDDGAAGAAALGAALEGTAVTTVHEATERRSGAVVVVLPAEAAGSLSRALLVSALRVAEEHVSLVHQAGPALAEAVSRVPHRPRRTRLPRLLRESGGAWQHER